MRLSKKWAIVVAAVLIMGGTGTSVALVMQPEEPKKVVEVKQAAVVEAQKPVAEEKVAVPAESEPVEVVAEPEPQPPTPEENKAWFVAEFKTNVRVLMDSLGKLEAANNHPGFWDMQERCAGQFPGAGEFNDRQKLEDLTKKLKRTYFDTALCHTLEL